MIGRLKSGFFMVVNGYIYYNNDSIKIRYDLLKEENNTTEYNDDQLFDYYEDVIQFEKEKNAKSAEYCETDMPIVEVNSERLIYLIKNQYDRTPKRLLILPFLHNRTVLMRQMNPNREYFSCILRENLD